jgi:hypothetical protein
MSSVLLIEEKRQVVEQITQGANTAILLPPPTQGEDKRCMLVFRDATADALKRLKAATEQRCSGLGDSVTSKWTV